MQEKVLLINVEYSQIVVCELINARLHNVQIENRLLSNNAVGDICCGRIQNVVRGLGAAFVDIGDGRTALLPLKDLDQDVQSGQFFLVQVSKAAVNEKGARLTTQISLPGRFVVLTNETGSIGISQKIKPKAVREYLYETAKTLVPDDCGIVIRTEAEKAQPEEIANDIELVKQRLLNIKHRFKESKIGVLHHENDLLKRIARDINSNTSRIIVDSPIEYSMLRELLQHLPQLAQRVELHDDARWILDVFHVTDDFRLARERVVKLPSGGNIVFDETEALTAIDVNTAQFVGKKLLSQTVLQTNIEAAREIARQLRLRNIGGVIVIDFIDLQEESARAQVLNFLAEELKKDRAKTRIVHFSSLNLLQMTRERRGQSLSQLLRKKCQICDGYGRVLSASSHAIDLYRTIRNTMARHGAARKFRVYLPVSLIEAFFGHDFEAIQAFEERWKVEVFITVEEYLQEVQVEVLSSEYHGFEPLNKQFSVKSQSVWKTKLGDFIVRNRVLMRLENAPEVASETTLWCEITTAGRWFCEGRVVLTGEAKVT